MSIIHWFTYLFDYLLGSLRDSLAVVATAERDAPFARPLIRRWGPIGYHPPDYFLTVAGLPEGYLQISTKVMHAMTPRGEET